MYALTLSLMTVSVHVLGNSRVRRVGSIFQSMLLADILAIFFVKEYLRSEITYILRGK